MNRVSTEKGDETRKIILKHIVAYINQHCYAPSHREICEMTGIKSTSTINHHITKMIECGMLETDCNVGTPRALRVPGYTFEKKEELYIMSHEKLTPQERTRLAVAATGNKWAMENFNATHN